MTDVVESSVLYIEFPDIGIGGVRDYLAMKHIRVTVDAAESLFRQDVDNVTPFPFALSANEFNQTARVKKIAVILHRSHYILSEIGALSAKAVCGSRFDFLFFSDQKFRYAEF